jgi:hypothetical protein
MPWEAFGVLRTEKKAAYGGLRFAFMPFRVFIPLIGGTEKSAL